MKRVFIICPVRNITEETERAIREYVEKLEKAGHNVHWPPRDTNQNDSIGLNICEQNREAIFFADEVHIWFDLKSQGSLFDMGMAFAYLRSMRKKIVIINRKELKFTLHKSFENVFLALADASA